MGLWIGRGFADLLVVRLGPGLRSGTGLLPGFYSGAHGKWEVAIWAKFLSRGSQEQQGPTSHTSTSETFDAATFADLPHRIGQNEYLASPAVRGAQKSAPFHGTGE